LIVQSGKQMNGQTEKESCNPRKGGRTPKELGCVCATSYSPLRLRLARHCEERSDEAIQNTRNDMVFVSELLRCATNDALGGGGVELIRC
jgi:hypothetical protein